MKKYIQLVFLNICIAYSAYAQSGFTQDRYRDSKTNNSEFKDAVYDFIEKNHGFLWDRSSSFAPQSTLFSSIDLSSYELISANISYSDANSKQKLVGSPFRFSNDRGKMGWLVNTKVNIALANGITTVGIGFGGDNSLYYSNHAKKVRSRIFGGNIPTPGVPEPNGSLTAYIVKILISKCDPLTADTLRRLFAAQDLAEIYAKYNSDVLAASYKMMDSLLLVYDKAMAENVFKWTIGYNAQLFSNLFSSGKVAGFDSLNYYNINSQNLSASFTYSHDNNCFAITGTFNQIWKRNSAINGQLMIPYYGPALSASVRLYKFISQSLLDTMASYRKSLFVPSVNLGVSFEGQYGDGSQKYNSFYKDGARTTVVWTPFIDILISQAIQFRISMPLTKTIYTANSKTFSAGANVQYNFNLANLGK